MIWAMTVSRLSVAFIFHTTQTKVLYNASVNIVGAKVMLFRGTRNT